MNANRMASRESGARVHKGVPSIERTCIREFFLYFSTECGETFPRKAAERVADLNERVFRGSFCWV